MKILVLPKYHKEGSSSRYRYFNYSQFFLQDGHTLIYKPLLYDGYVADLYEGKKALKRRFMLFWGIIKRIIYLTLHRRKFDLIIIEKELVTFMPFILEKILLNKSKFILDYDDNIHARYQFGLSKVFLKSKILRMAKLADAVTVGNHWYRSLYKDIDQSRVYYLPTVIDRDLYTADSDVTEDSAPLSIVWIGSLSTVKYLKSIDQVLIKLQRQYNFTLKVIGATTDLNCDVDFIEWNSETEISELRKSDIGIMPLEDTEWEKGKCGFKLIQYMAVGLPVVASFSPANSEIINDDCGFIARNENEWIDHLSTLLSSSSLRRSLGEKGKKRVFENYSYQKWGPVFLEIIKKVNKE